MLSVAEPFARALRSLPASVKTIVMVMVDGAVVIIAMLMARALRIPDAILPPHGTLHLHLIGPVASIVSMALFGLYQSASRGHSMRIEQRIVLAQLAATVFWVGYLQLFELKSFPRSIPGIFLAMAAVGLVIERRFATYVLAPKKQLLPRRERLPVFIYGTGTDAIRPFPARGAV
jgi:FlaA1/EpsC-like NDP-sugar epimerase